MMFASHALPRRQQGKIQASTVVFIAIAVAAGDEIEAVQQGQFRIEEKEDDTPVTEADFRAHRLIKQQLVELSPRLPLLSEEGSNPLQAHEEQWPAYWLVDPLDGTKEFIANNGEYTVNIALILHGKTAFGVVYAPATRTLYWGGHEYGAWRFQVPQSPDFSAELAAESINVRAPQTPLLLLGSRRHGGAAHEDLLAALKQRWQQVEQIAVGSSLKLCRVAEGEADLYARFGPTSEWDIAAGQAVLEGAGGRVWTLAKTPLNYRRADIINPDFYALGGKEEEWHWL